MFLTNYVFECIIQNENVNVDSWPELANVIDKPVDLQNHENDSMTEWGYRSTQMADKSWLLFDPENSATFDICIS